MTTQHKHMCLYTPQHISSQSRWRVLSAAVAPLTSGSLWAWGKEFPSPVLHLLNKARASLTLCCWAARSWSDGGAACWHSRPVCHPAVAINRPLYVWAIAAPTHHRFRHTDCTNPSLIGLVKVKKKKKCPESFCVFGVGNSWWEGLDHHGWV